jgi:DNA-binding transcriptional regulator YiaG
MENWLHYTACGLDNVWLANGFAVKETKYGTGVSIEDVDGLHRLLASNLVEREGLLTGKEFRFLRVHLGLTQQGLGKLLGDVSENAVSLWERKDSVPAIYDHWLRMLVIAKFKGNTKVADAVQRIQTVERLVHQKYVVRGEDGNRRVEVVKDSEADQLELTTA